MPRWYFRCPDCLSVSAIDADREPASARCSCCDVPVEGLGRVFRERLVRDEERCACDERCTCAQGPRCNCRCGGENHGSGLVVTVQIDAGGIPRITPPDARAIIRRDEWRAMLAKVREAAPGARESRIKASGGYLDAHEYRKYCDGLAWHRAIRRARGLRTHHGRMAALRRMLEPEAEDHNHAGACNHGQTAIGW